MFRLFFEVQYHNKPDLNRIFPESVHDCSPLHVCSFILSILHQGIFSVSAFIVSVIYLSRFKESSHITLHACTWRPLFLTSLLLADKMWEDKPVRNSSLAKLFPVLSNLELNRLESEFLGEIGFNVLVKPDLFCSFCEKLLSESVHQEITRCVATSDYAGTLQADTVESEKQPSKPPKVVANEVTSDASKLQAGQNRSKLQHDSKAEHEEQFNPAPRTASGNSWMGDSAGSAHAGMPSAVPPQVVSTDASGVVPRSQSAGATSSRRHEGARLTPGSQPLLVSLRGSNASTTLAGSNTGPASGSTSRPGNVSDRPMPGGAPPPGSQPPKVTSTTPNPPRSVSVHPLNRTESQKKHPMGKVEDQQLTPPEQQKIPQPGPTPTRAGHVAAGAALRRSLPAKTSSGYAPLARAPSGGGSSSGITRLGGVESGGSGHGGPHPGASSGPGSANTTSSAPRGPSQTSPRSPGGLVEPQQSLSGQPAAGGRVAQAHVGGRGPASSVDEATPPSSHMGQQTGRSNSHPRVTSSQTGPGRYGAAVQGSQGMGAAAPRVATPPVPLSSGHLASHSGPPGQAGAPLNHSSRGPPPGAMGHQASGSSSQPARASSAPRVSGIAGHHHHQHPHNPHAATPPGSSSVRTAASQPAGQAPAGSSRIPGHHHVPASPTGHSPMGANTYSSASPAVPHHYGSAAPGNNGSGASVVVFPANSANRGTSPTQLGLVGGPPQVGSQMAMKSGRSTVGSTSGLQRNASPMGVPTPASPAGRPLSPAGNVPMSSMSASAQRPDLLSTTRGRSPPPGVGGAPSGPSTVRAPRAVTPGQIVKGIQQGMGHSANMQRSSFGGGGMVMHRGLG